MPIYKFSLTLRNALAQSIIDACDAGSGACKLNFRSRSVGTWAGGRTYAVGDSVYANGKNHDCTTAGTSAGTAPTWPTSGTVTDGTAVWTEGGDAGADTLLGTLTASDPSATKTNGIITFAAITQDAAADASGKARRVVVTASDDVTVMELDVTHEAGTGAVKINTVTIFAGGPIQMNSFTITMGGA